MQQMDERMKKGLGIYCKGSCAHVLVRNVKKKSATEVNGLSDDLILVLYTRTGNKTRMCELHKHAE